MKNKHFLHFAAIAATMLMFTNCSNNETVLGEVPEVVVPATKGHPLTITASIDGGTATRMVSEEGTNGIKLTWDLADKLYLLTSADGTTWDNIYYTFGAKEVDTDNASKATFVCEDFDFPIGTTKVKLIYTSGDVSAKADLEKTAQSLGQQSGKMADVAKYLHMETAALTATSEDDVKNLTAQLAHSNAVMKVVIAKSDIEWGNDYVPAQITMKLESSSLQLRGTTDNTITINNTTAWTADNKIVANVVVCMDGSASANDRWIFTTKDALGNSLIKATASAKTLEGGKRYNAPMTFFTGDYFPLLSQYFVNFTDGGTFDESTKTLVTGMYGAMGWSFETPLNLSAYKYLVIEATDGYNKGTQFRMIDEGGFWGGTQAQPLISDAKTVLELDELDAGLDEAGTFTPTRKLNKANITNIPIWSFGGEDHKLVFSKIYLTNTLTDEPTPPTGDGNTNITAPGIDDSGEDAF
ncbi:hypothetical protein [Bacteroides sp. 51]|uniref:hypothetical protein n=1 Tax=Bacteroides sp. 51 TaxID=2302938 RepID=UPI0013D19F04|nr:hypothetical protein [Bacteroides sp. 51]NDV80875.1 hypothetical protein [Bacteroides sp. 51]